MKKPKFVVNIICLALSILILAACGADAESAKWKSVKTETFGDVPYNIVYVSNDDETCQVKEVRVDKDYEGDIHLVIPEKAPNGDIVTKLDTWWGYNVLPFNVPSYMTLQTVCNEIKDFGPLATEGDSDDIGYNPERDAKTFLAFYREKSNTDGKKYYVIEPVISRSERSRLADIMSAYGYDSDDCYEFLMNFLGEIPENEEEKNELTREAFKYLYLNGNRITEITISQTVKYIEYGAFSGCEKLSQINGLSKNCKIAVFVSETTQDGELFIEKNKLEYVGLDDKRLEKSTDDTLKYFLHALNN